MTTKPVIFAAAVVLIVVGVYYFESTKSDVPAGAATDSDINLNDIPTATSEAGNLQTTTSGDVDSQSVQDDQDKKITLTAREEKAKKYDVAKEISTPDGFINTPSEGITIKSLIGKKIILVDFWTYSCINCKRTTPYLNAWYKKYKDKGLEIIGLHTPEFEFEKKYENVLAAVKNEHIEYPVVLDNDYSTWQAYHNRFWPRKYLIDIDGYIVYNHIGEGAYEETEREIQEALDERMKRLGIAGDVGNNISAPADVVEFNQGKVGSPETYFGSARNDFLENGSAHQNGMQSFAAPQSPALNKLYLVGDWSMASEYAESKSAGAKIIFKYNAKNVNFVVSGGTGSEIRVTRDGQAVGSWVGSDMTQKDGAVRVTIDHDDQYNIISDPDGYGEHTLEIIIDKPGLRAHTFTFG